MSLVRRQSTPREVVTEQSPSELVMNRKIRTVFVSKTEETKSKI